MLIELVPCVFTDDVITDRSSRMNVEVYAQLQPNALNTFGWCVTV